MNILIFYLGYAAVRLVMLGRAGKAKLSSFEDALEKITVMGHSHAWRIMQVLLSYDCSGGEMLHLEHLHKLQVR